MAIRPLRDDPLAVRLLVYHRPGCGPPYETAYAEPAAAHREAALHAGPYRQWLVRHGSLLLRAG